MSGSGQPVLFSLRWIALFAYLGSLYALFASSFLKLYGQDTGGLVSIIIMLFVLIATQALFVAGVGRSDLDLPMPWQRRWIPLAVAAVPMSVEFFLLALELADANIPDVASFIVLFGVELAVLAGLFRYGRYRPRVTFARHVLLMGMVISAVTAGYGFIDITRPHGPLDLLAGAAAALGCICLMWVLGPLSYVEFARKAVDSGVRRLEIIERRYSLSGLMLFVAFAGAFLGALIPVNSIKSGADHPAVWVMLVLAPVLMYRFCRRIWRWERSLVA